MPGSSDKAHFAAYRKAAAFLKGVLDSQSFPATPVIGLILGSGLSGLSDVFTNTVTVNYASIPGFPSSTTVQGHKGEIVFGFLGNVPAMCFRGRFHSYEGHDMNTTALPARIMRCLGVKLLIVTNAAGGINKTYNVGDVVSVMDYLAIPMLAGKNPLVGPNDDELGPRFPPTSNAFDEKLQEILVKASTSLGMNDFIRENGTYCFVSGPMYESKAECRFLRNLGGDCVGMSTVPEIVAAHHSGMKVICLSLVTNKVIVDGTEGPPASHEEVLEAVELRSKQLQDLVKTFVQILDESKYLQELPKLKEISLDVTDFEDEKKVCMFRCPHMKCSIPLHCLIMGAGVLALGAVLGNKRK